jgi:hypothetical protein
MLLLIGIIVLVVGACCCWLRSRRRRRNRSELTQGLLNVAFQDPTEARSSVFVSCAFWPFCITKTDAAAQATSTQADASTQAHATKEVEIKAGDTEELDADIKPSWLGGMACDKLYIQPSTNRIELIVCRRDRPTDIHKEGTIDSCIAKEPEHTAADPFDGSAVPSPRFELVTARWMQLTRS